MVLETALNGNKVSTLRTAESFRERAGRADRRETLRILTRAGKGNPPQAGDELPPSRDLEREGQKKTAPTKGAFRKRGKEKAGSR